MSRWPGKYVTSHLHPPLVKLAREIRYHTPSFLHFVPPLPKHMCHTRRRRRRRRRKKKKKKKKKKRRRKRRTRRRRKSPNGSTQTQTKVSGLSPPPTALPNTDADQGERAFTTAHSSVEHRHIPR